MINVKGWKEIKIKHLGKIVTGNTPSRKKPELYGKHTLFVKPTDINAGKKYCYSPSECYSELGFNQYKKSLIPKGSTCVVTIGSIGKKMTMAHTDLFINQAMNAIIPNKNYDKHFVYYLLKLNLFQLKTFDSGTASGRENVSKSSFSNIKVTVPESIQTQRKIASILSAYDDLIENNLKRIKLLEEKARLTYEEWFVRMKFPGHENTPIDEATGLPEGWSIKLLQDVAKINSKSLGNSSFQTIHYIDIASVSSGKITHFTTFNHKNAPGRAKRIVQHGDIIWSCVRPNRKSYTVIWKPLVNLIVSTGFCVITPNSLPTSYLLQYLTTNKFIGYLTNRAGGAAYPAVKATDFKQASIVVPSEELIHIYNYQLKNYLEVAWNLQQQNQLLKEARDLLLPRLMMGIIDVEQIDLDSLLPNPTPQHP